MLPPPRFKVEYCSFATKLQDDLQKAKSSNLRTKKLRPAHRYDDRELCPDCDACISVTTHSGLPDHRSILFTSHIARDHRLSDDKATFACNSCYKTFDDSYAFMDHVFQKQIGSDRSCMRRTSSKFSLYEEFMESDPSLVERCLRNCLERELTRVRTMKMKSTIRVVETEIHPSSRASAKPWPS
jgi:ferredoxin